MKTIITIIALLISFALAAQEYREPFAREQLPTDKGFVQEPIQDIYTSSPTLDIRSWTDGAYILLEEEKEESIILRAGGKEGDDSGDPTKMPVGSGVWVLLILSGIYVTRKYSCRETGTSGKEDI